MTLNQRMEDEVLKCTDWLLLEGEAGVVKIEVSMGEKVMRTGEDMVGASKNVGEMGKKW